MRRCLRMIPFAGLAAVALVLPSSDGLAAPAIVAVRALELAGGGCLQVATRYLDSSYEPGRPLLIDPLVATRPCPVTTAAQPVIVAGRVEPRRHTFTPCVDRSATGAAEGRCADGTEPVTIDAGSPAGFSFSFLRLFRGLPERIASGVGPEGFGSAAFLVTLDVIAANGAHETVRFPVTVAVRQPPPER